MAAKARTPEARAGGCGGSFPARLAHSVRPGEGLLTETDSNHSTVAAATALPARGSVKTLKSQQGRELFSLLPLFWFQPRRYSSLD
jgi:hypothetical protein